MGDYLFEYEQQCREMSGPEQMEENALAFKEWRSSQRNEHQAYERWLVICGVRLEAPEHEELAQVIDLIPRQREGEALVREEI